MFYFWFKQYFIASIHAHYWWSFFYVLPRLVYILLRTKNVTSKLYGCFTMGMKLFEMKRERRDLESILRFYSNCCAVLFIIII